MNSYTFTVLFANLAVLLATANGIFFNTAGTGTSVVNGANIILATGTAGTLATPLAILGVWTLAAAGAVALGLLNRDDEGDDYGRSDGRLTVAQRARILRQQRRHRTQRSAPVDPAAGLAEDDAIFGVLAAMDTYGCGKQLLCELEAKPVHARDQDEVLLVRLFGDQKAKKNYNPASPKAEFELAAQLGLATKSQVICRERFPQCPYTAPEMMAALRNAKW